MKREMKIIIGALLSLNVANSWADEGASHHHHMSGSGQEMEMPMSEMVVESGMEMESEMDHTAHSELLQQSPVTGLRDPHAWSDGYGFGPIPQPHLADEHPMGGVVAELFKARTGQHSDAVAYELQGWYGHDYERAVIKAKKDADGGRIKKTTTELLGSRAIAPFWNGELGVRHDSGNAPDRNWLAVAVEGLAPYWLDINASAYLGNEGRSALTVAAEYELLLTQRLILQPHVEANFYGKRDSEWMVDSGLSEVITGVRLRYEIEREFAPFIGIEWTDKYGGTADMARNAGLATHKQHRMVGVRLWF